MNIWKRLENFFQMNENLCDRCYGLAYQILETYDLKNDFANVKEVKNKIKCILDLLNNPYDINSPKKKLGLFNYNFFMDSGIKMAGLILYNEFILPKLK